MPRTFFFFLCCTLLLPAQAATQSLVPLPGEISLEGTVGITVAADGFVLQAEWKTVGAGKRVKLTPAQTKTVMLGGKSLVQVRGDANSEVAMHDLKKGVRVVVIGHELFEGRSIKARQVWVWDGEKGGKFSWSGPKTTGVADDAPPAEPAFKGVNLLTDGGFQKARVGGLPDGWWARPGTTARVREHQDLRWLHISNDDADEVVSVSLTLPLKSEWKPCASRRWWP